MKFFKIIILKDNGNVKKYIYITQMWLIYDTKQATKNFNS